MQALNGNGKTANSDPPFVRFDRMLPSSGAMLDGLKEMAARCTEEAIVRPLTEEETKTRIARISQKAKHLSDEEKGKLATWLRLLEMRIFGSMMRKIGEIVRMPEPQAIVKELYCQPVDIRLLDSPKTSSMFFEAFEDGYGFTRPQVEMMIAMQDKEQMNFILYSGKKLRVTRDGKHFLPVLQSVEIELPNNEKIPGILDVKNAEAALEHMIAATRVMVEFYQEEVLVMREGTPKVLLTIEGHQLGAVMSAHINAASNLIDYQKKLSAQI